jgi:5'-3' exonuclease
MRIVFYDAYNLIYRARHALPPAMQATENGITFAFFRSLAALNRKLQPDIAFFVTEGRPNYRLQLHEDYKGNRKQEKDENFSRQRREIIRIINDYFPLTVANHPNHECDDVIAHLATEYDDGNNEVIVVSTDTDFLQLANTLGSYKQYDPIRKSYKELPDFDYVAWKALRGDASDNIDGFKGIGDKRAHMLLQDPAKLQQFLDIPGHKEKYARNLELIAFLDVSKDETVITFSKDTPDWETVYNMFIQMNFKSIIGEKGWANFTSAFKFSTLEGKSNDGSIRKFSTS